MNILRKAEKKMKNPLIECGKTKIPKEVKYGIREKEKNFISAFTTERTNLNLRRII
jgi:hypothetical protein